MEVTRWPKRFWKCPAEVLQMPKRSFFDLRDSRKHQSKRRETCGIPANAKANAGRLAGVPANAKANAARLAGVPANAKAFPARLAELPRGISKSTLAAYSARSKAFSRDKEPLTHVVYEITHYSMQNAFEEPSPIGNETQYTFCMPLSSGDAIFRAYSLRLPVIF